ncbi:MAG: hypothetical protein H8K07_00495 [Nitrospira sp.]|nr:hypothetical protein [Nitrospira sp.]MDI3465869.1 hypothetical protein [Nitrospira sp.]
MQVSAMIDRVYGALEQFGTTCSMEEVVGLCPDLTWNQVYLAIDYLNKTGKVSVTLDPDRTYTVKVYPSAGEGSQYSRQDHVHSTV